jgi:hypothetical protein
VSGKYSARLPNYQMVELLLDNTFRTLWGKNLQEHFESIYRQQARFCVMFIS